MHYPESHYRWEWQLASSPEELWPLVSDTDRFNHATGVPPVEDRAAAGAALHNARRRLHTVRLGVPLDWEEEPFEWIRPLSFGVVRNYTRGPLAQMRVLAELTPRPAGGAPGLVIEAFQASLKGIEGYYDVWRVRRPDAKT